MVIYGYFAYSTVMAIMDGVAILAPRPCLGAWRIEACGPQYQRRHPFERTPHFVPAFFVPDSSPTGAAGYGAIAATGWAQRPCDEAMMRPPPHTAAVGLNGASCLIRPPPQPHVQPVGVQKFEIGHLEELRLAGSHSSTQRLRPRSSARAGRPGSARRLAAYGSVRYRQLIIITRY